MHDGLMPYRDAIEATIGAQEWGRGSTYAIALESLMREESLPWAQFGYLAVFITRPRPW